MRGESSMHYLPDRGLRVRGESSMYYIPYIILIMWVSAEGEG